MRVQNVPSEIMDPFLSTAFPNIVYPYAREVLSVIVVRADFGATIPAGMQSLTADGASYKIITVAPSADRSHLLISCKDKNAGA